MTTETLAAARDSISSVFGVLPSWFSASGQGPAIRERQRHLATSMLQPTELLSEEASEKHGGKVEVETYVLTPLQAFDQGGSARALATIIGALSEAKAASLSDAAVAAAFAKLDW